MQGQVAARSQGRGSIVGRRALQRLHPDIISNQNTLEADPVTDRGNARRRDRGRAVRVDRGVDAVRHHRPRRIGNGAEGREISDFQGVAIGGNVRQIQMAVGGRAAMTGDMLDDRRHSGVAQAEGDRLGQNADQHRIGGKRAVADDRMGFGQQQIRHRCAGDIDAQIGQHRPDNPPDSARSGEPGTGGRVPPANRWPVPAAAPASVAGQAERHVRPPGRSGPAHRLARPSRVAPRPAP